MDDIKVKLKKVDYVAIENCEDEYLNDGALIIMQRMITKIPSVIILNYMFQLTKAS